MGWLRNLFGRRKSVGPSVHGDSPEDWRAGDLAECLHDGVWFIGAIIPTDIGPRKDEVRYVADVEIVPHPFDRGRKTAMLGFDRYVARFDAVAFRKITPRADSATAADAEFVRRLRQSEDVGV